MRIAVIGGTGLMGRHVINVATEAGLETVSIARSTGVDVLTGSGLTEALSGADAAIDVTNIVTLSKKKSVDFFSTAASSIVTAAQAAGVAHLVPLSIVGCDRVDLPYYFGKRAQEDRVREGSVPWTIVRATQFFEFPDQFLSARSPIIGVPKMLSQPVLAREVAQVLVDVAAAEPTRTTVEVAGPTKEQMVAMAKRVAKARGIRRPIIGLPIPGVNKSMNDGSLTPSGEHVPTSTTFEQYLASQ